MILCFTFLWVTLIRNVQIRIIYDHLEPFNIPHPDNPDRKELADHICSCCRSSCGPPIYHNKVEGHNHVKSCKYYFVTLRGLNFITSITNIVGWFLVALISIFTVQHDSSTHFLIVCAASGFVYFYQFVHAVVLYRQRKVEYAQNREQHRCRWFTYFWDVVFCFGVPLVSLTCMVLYLLGQFDMAGMGPIKYEMEWAWFTLFVAYY